MRNILVRQRYFQIFVNRQAVDQVITLKDESDVVLVQFVPLFDAEFVHRLFEEKIFAGPRSVEHSKNAQQRRLASPRRAHDRDKLARLNLQRNTAKHEVFAASQIVSFLQILELNEWRHCSPSSLNPVMNQVEFSRQQNFAYTAV